MPDSFFFYDLETSGVNPRTARIMQFAGQRTDLELNPLGDPVNILIKLSEDVLPEPDAILITGITPQMTLTDGVTEAEFFKLFCEDVVQDGTVFVGFNNIRFDDEFIRYGLYRNFYDSYEWQWKNGCSKWDILDLTRITRALRPDGIKWPFAHDGKPTNRLEMITSLNGLDHENAHDALNDVMATIAVAKLIKEKQPKLFEYEFSMRGKREVEMLVTAGEPFVYVSGKYPAEHEKLAVVFALGKHPKKAGSLVYDLRHDPEPYLNLTAEKLAELMRWNKDQNADRLPIKTLQYNRCPAVAPLPTLRPEDAPRLKVNRSDIYKHLEILKQNANFYDKVVSAVKIIEAEYTQTALVPSEQDVDAGLYNGFFPDGDKELFSNLRNENPENLADYFAKLRDERLKVLLPLYKARNYPKSLTSSEREVWEKFRLNKLQKSLPKFIERIQILSTENADSSEKQYLLEELRLYAESIMPDAS